jgi:peptidoglycan/xylan/chitin deacetylase (PgdA/CDA1 family)
MPRVRIALVLALVVVVLVPVRAGASTQRTTSTQGCPPALPGVRNAAPALSGHARSVALTFDDGPGVSTTAIISVLRRARVRATFFNIGQEVRLRPVLVRQEANDGFLLGDHTNSHPVLSKLSRRRQLAEIDQSAVLQHRLSGSAICALRPPYGAFNAATQSVARERGLTLWMWSDGGGDWLARGSSSPRWVRSIISAVTTVARHQRHPVVLLHDQRGPMPATVRALPAIIHWFRAHRYAFVDLLGRGGPPGACGEAHAPLVPPATSLTDGTVLDPGAERDSPNGQYTFALSAAGALTWSLTGGRTLWRVEGPPGARARVAGGAIELITPGGAVAWSSPSVPGAKLALGDDGALALRGATANWFASARVSELLPGDQLRAGSSLYSPRAGCVLTQLSSGALTLRGADGETLWRDAVSAPGASTTLASDGNLVTARSGVQVWSSATAGHRLDRLVVGDQGRVLLLDARGDHLWATP